MCERAVRKDPWLLKFIPDRYSAPVICEKAVDTRSWVLEFVADQYKTPGMCEGVVVVIYAYLNLFLIGL